MKLKTVLKLSIKDIIRNIKKMFFTSAGVVSGIIIIVFFLSFGLGTFKSIVHNILELFPVNELKVTTEGWSINLPVLNKLKFNSSKKISDRELEKFKAINGIESIYPQMNISFPVSIYIDMYGYHFKSDLTVSGLSEQLILKDEVELHKKFKFDTGAEYIPALVSYQILEMYNDNFAESNNLPKFTKKTLIGRHFTLIFGESSFNIKSKKISKKCEIIGFSKRATALGLTIPFEAVKYYNKWYFGDNYKPVYKNVFIYSDITSHIKRIKNKIEEMGFSVVSLDNIVDRITLVIFSITGIFVVTGIIILLISCLNIFNTFALLMIMHNNEIKVMRALGAAISDIKIIYLTESFLIGFFSGITGVIFGKIIIKISDMMLINYIPDFSLKPDTFFYTPVWTVLVIIFLSIIFCCSSVLFALGTNRIK